MTIVSPEEDGASEGMMNAGSFVSSSLTMTGNDGGTGNGGALGTYPHGKPGGGEMVLSTTVSHTAISKVSSMLDVPPTILPPIEDALEKEAFLAELGEQRQRKRRTRRRKRREFIMSNYCDCCVIPDEIPEFGRLTLKMKIDYVLQTRGVLWFTLTLLVLDFIALVWEHNVDEELAGNRVLLLITTGFQVFCNMLFALQIGLTGYVRGWRNYLKDNWHKLDVALVYISLAMALTCVFVFILSAEPEGAEYYCQIRHIVLLRFMPVVHSLSENDLRFRGRTAASDLDVETNRLTVPSSNIKLGRKLGAGAFGQVFLGLYSGTLVAVKSLHEVRKENSEAFYREASILIMLRHPNIVLFMGVVDEPDNLWLITEYCSRGSLQHLIRSTELFPPGKLNLLCVEIAQDVCCGLAYLHGHRYPIVHRDLKAANVLIAQSFVAKVADFGESVIRARLSKSTQLVGTVQYTAPEVLRAEGYTAAADIYSLGMVLWQMGTREVPYRNMNQIRAGFAVSFEGLRPDMDLFPRSFEPGAKPPRNHAVGNRKCDGDKLLFADRQSGILEAYRDIMMRCWAENPEERPTATEVLSCLELSLEKSGYQLRTIDDELDSSQSDLGPEGP